jgi:twitching motility two-component system response regulator PilH
MKMAGKKILVVEDSPTDMEYLSSILSRRGYQVIRATTGEESLVKARSLGPDIILMDVVLPGMSGFEATRKLARDAATQRIPVIICSSKKQETDRIWGMRQGATDYVTKPVDEKVLLSKIAALS